MTIAANPTASAQAGAPADSTPDADSVFEEVFGFADDGESEEVAEEPAPAPAKPAKAAKPAPRGTVEPAADDEEEEVADEGADEDEESDEEEEVDELDYDHLAKVAAERAGKRESKSGADAKVRELEQTVAQLQRTSTEAQTAVAVLNKLRGMEKSDPLALLETMGITGDKLVTFLQTGHRQAINRAGFKQAQTVEQLQEMLATQAQEIEALKTGVPKAIKQTADEQRWEENQREFVALTESSDAYPFLAAEDPEARIGAAQQAVAVLVGAGHKKLTHELVARVAESRARKAFEKKAALLGKRVVADAESDQEVVAPSGGGAAAKGSQTNGSSAKKRAPSTVTQTAAASPPDPRKMSAAELEAEAERVVAEIFLA